MNQNLTNRFRGAVTPSGSHTHLALPLDRARGRTLCNRPIAEAWELEEKNHLEDPLLCGPCRSKALRLLGVSKRDGASPD